MCGIAGIRTFSDRSPDPAALGRMAATLEPRGPDGGGVLVRNDVGMAHRRLKIIDRFIWRKEKVGWHLPRHFQPCSRLVASTRASTR